MGRRRSIGSFGERLSTEHHAGLSRVDATSVQHIVPVARRSPCPGRIALLTRGGLRRARLNFAVSAGRVRLDPTEDTNQVQTTPTARSGSSGRPL